MNRQYFALEVLHISTMYSEMIVLCSWLEESGCREETIDSPSPIVFDTVSFVLILIRSSRYGRYTIKRTESM